MSSISVIINTEKGRLEAESKMLVDSIRSFGGAFSNVPIYSYQPRKNSPISSETIKFFEQNEVIYVDEDLNKENHDFPMCNKFYVCAHAEKNIDSDILVFMDSDSVVWQEPTEFYLADEVDLAMVPVFMIISTKNLAAPYESLDLSENNSNFVIKHWRQLSKELNFPLDKHVNTVVDNRKILTYYNGGLRVSRKTTGYFQQCLDNFEFLLQKKVIDKKTNPFEQTTYSATALSMGLKIIELGKGYNYPLAHHKYIENPRYYLDSLDKVVTGHYTILFKRAGWKNPMTKRLTQGEKGKWLEQKALEYGLYKPWYKKLFNS